ncbi:hypothetical protein Cadr_000031031 [Camelus dromedarius]|uniref:Uncharacterized protein n=1 Tax=Camelus dromedarius TaxID=9838 RepID=A0A5N4C0G2_CAMDR|nr:hypothetical protein Cadr_000031031 [Camelus dromedarius]
MKIPAALLRPPKYPAVDRRRGTSGPPAGLARCGSCAVCAESCLRGLCAHLHYALRFHTKAPGILTGQIQPPPSGWNHQELSTCNRDSARCGERTLDTPGAGAVVQQKAGDAVKGGGSRFLGKPQSMAHTIPTPYPKFLAPPTQGPICTLSLWLSFETAPNPATGTPALPPLLGQTLSSWKLPSSANSRPAAGLADLHFKYPSWSVVRAWAQSSIFPTRSPGPRPVQAKPRTRTGECAPARLPRCPAHWWHHRPSLRPAPPTCEVFRAAPPSPAQSSCPISLHPPPSWPRPGSHWLRNFCPRTSRLGRTYDASARGGPRGVAMATGAVPLAGRRALLGRAAGSGSVQLPGTMAVLAAGDDGLLGLATSSGLVSRRTTSCPGRRPTNSKRTSAPLAGPVDMNRRGGSGLGWRPGRGCGAGERVEAGGTGLGHSLGLSSHSGAGAGAEMASQNPPGRAGRRPVLDEAGRFPGFEEPQKQMLEWGGLSALFICREISDWPEDALHPLVCLPVTLLCDVNPSRGLQDLHVGVCIHIALPLKTLLKMEGSAGATPLVPAATIRQSLDITRGWGGGVGGGWGGGVSGEGKGRWEIAKVVRKGGVGMGVNGGGGEGVMKGLRKGGVTRVETVETPCGWQPQEPTLEGTKAETWGPGYMGRLEGSEAKIGTKRLDSCGGTAPPGHMGSGHFPTAGLTGHKHLTSPLSGPSLQLITWHVWQRPALRSSMTLAKAASPLGLSFLICRTGVWAVNSASALLGPGLWRKVRSACFSKEPVPRLPRWQSGDGQEILIEDGGRAPPATVVATQLTGAGESIHAAERGLCGHHCCQRGSASIFYETFLPIPRLPAREPGPRSCLPWRDTGSLEKQADLTFLHNPGPSKALAYGIHCPHPRSTDEERETNSCCSLMLACVRHAKRGSGARQLGFKSQLCHLLACPLPMCSLRCPAAARGRRTPT